MTRPTIQKISKNHGMLPKAYIIISINKYIYIYIYNRQVEIES
jgi:hypothetical protein